MSDLVEREERPAYVRFETRAIADKAASLEAGHYVAKDEDWALITPPYSKDCVERKVDGWFESLEENVRNNRVPEKWMRTYKEAYEAWKSGQEIPLNGTSVKNWAAISPAQVQNLVNAGCRTIEDLAIANDEALRRLGMGGMELRNKAQAYLKASNDVGSVVEENASLKAKMGQLEGTIESLQNQINLMVRQGAQTSKPELASNPLEISAKDVIDESPAEKPKFELQKQDPELVKAYTEKFGKKPHHMTKDAGIRKKLKE